MKKYYPIFIAKKGELKGLQYLAQNVKEEICPVFEIIQKSIFKTKTNKETKEKIMVYDTDFEKYFSTHWSFEGNSIIFDFSYFENIEDYIVTIERLILNLINDGINIILAVQNNSPSEYLELVKRIISKKRINICIRASNQSGGFIAYNKIVERLMDELRVYAKNTILLIDIGFLSETDYSIRSSLAYSIVNMLPPFKNWIDVVIASGSFPKDLTDFNIGASQIPRYEWGEWLKLENEFPFIKYADYGTRHPNFDEVSFPGTVSVRYTLPESFLVVRGEKADVNDFGNGQYIQHANTIVKHPDYSGKDFSHGDKEIHEKSLIALYNEDGEIKKSHTGAGNPTVWVQLSFSHHITLICSLL